MPPAQVDAGQLLLSAALAPLGDCARAGGAEVLALYPDVGDRDTQLALDRRLDQIAALLREIDATAADLATRLRPPSVRDAGIDEGAGDDEADAEDDAAVWDDPGRREGKQ